MKSFNAVALSTLIGLAAIGATGCSTAQKGAAAGGVIGGVAGGITGNNIPGAGVGTSAVIGGTSGVAVGGLAGDAYDQVTKADSSRELENLRAELQTKNGELAALRARSMSPDELAEMQETKEKLEQLVSSLEAAKNQNAELASAENTGKLTALQAEADALRNRVAEAEAGKTAMAEKLATLEAEKTALESAITEKEAAFTQLNDQVGVLRTSLYGKEKATQELKAELDSMNVQLEETNRGLTLTIVDSLLFKAGSAELTPDGKVLINRVGAVIQTRFPNREMTVEGHTDNQPIKRSGWESNWELGAGRALSIVHELVSKQGIDPTKISATTYGETRPAVSNSTPEGRKANRRAVIVILPENLPVQRESLASAN